MARMRHPISIDVIAIHRFTDAETGGQFYATLHELCFMACWRDILFQSGRTHASLNVRRKRVI